MSTEKNSCDTNGVCAPAVGLKTNISTHDEVEIVYGYDPLCGWCYGFSSDLKIIREKYRDRIKFTLVNGGIFAGPKGVPMGQISEHINRNMPYVTDRSGTEFGSKFKELLLHKEFPYDSEKASIAVVAFRDLDPEHVFEFASDIQTAFFFDGADIQSNETYKKLIQPYAIDSEEFIKKINSEDYKSKTYLEFKKAAQYNLAYPSCIIINGNKSKVLTYGYENASSVIEKIENAVGQSFINPVKNAQYGN